MRQITTEKLGLVNVSFQRLNKQFILMEMFTEKVKVFQVTILILKVEMVFGFRELKKMELIDINLEKD
ncbi:hypothetical protein FLWE109334_11740 [Flavobacterium weaverense]